MACDVDELDINPFFRALQTKFIDLYNVAQEKCYTVCIPQSTSIAGTDINKDFAETHILKPSPYFKGELLTSHSTHSKTVTLANDGCSIITGDGFQCKLLVKIVSEELAYNKEYDQYRVLILEQPLDPKFQHHAASEEKGTSHLPTQCVSLKECKAFLHSIPECKKALERVDQGVRQFNSNYMVLPDYLTEAAARLADISAQAAENCVRATGRVHAADTKWRETLEVAMESYVMSCVHDKVFGVVSQLCAADDGCVDGKIQQQLKGIPAEALGIRRRFACPLPAAVTQLSNLDYLRTPGEKLHCLKAVIDSVTSAITAHLSRDIPPHLALTADAPCLTSDDLIPILVCVIGQAECQHLRSDVVYMETFAWASSTKDLDDLSYCLVTFKAAMQYIIDTDFSQLQQKSKKQVGVDRMSSAVDRLSISNGKGESTPSPRISPTPFTHAATATTQPSTDRLSRQMTRVSKALDESSQGKEEKKVKSIFGAEYEVPVALEAAPKPKAAPDLGDFLSSLQDDFVSYGKQS